MQPSAFEIFASQVMQDVQTPTDEAAIRTVIGRMYYAAYHDALQWVEARFSLQVSDFKDAAGASAGMHRQLQLCYKDLQRKQFDFLFSQVAALLNDLHVCRVEADYSMALTVGHEKAKYACLQKQKINTHLNSLKAKYP